MLGTYRAKFLTLSVFTIYIQKKLITVISIYRVHCRAIYPLAFRANGNEYYYLPTFVRHYFFSFTGKALKRAHYRITLPTLSNYYRSMLMSKRLWNGLYRKTFASLAFFGSIYPQYEKTGVAAPNQQPITNRKPTKHTIGLHHDR